MKDTTDPAYARRLQNLSDTWWKRFLDVQRPYRWNLRRLNLGRTLDVGCGIGRNLKSLSSRSVGIDHNQECVAAARSLGLRAYTPEEFKSSSESHSLFDSMLVAHVLEHLDCETANSLLSRYLTLVRPGGAIVLITPQEAGFAADETHVRFVDFNVMERHAQSVGLRIARSFSFPLPRFAGTFFPYNEFVAICPKR